MFSGEVRHQMDEKGRIRIPTRYKDDIGAHPYAMCGAEGCIIIYPKETAEKLMAERFAGIDFADIDRARGQRILMSRSFDLEEDKQGRYLLPTKLINHAHLTKNIVTIGSYDRIEIWDEQAWDNYCEGVQVIDGMKLLSGAVK